MAYANGRLPDSALAPAANGTPAQRLEIQTAKQWAAMVTAAAIDGIVLRPAADDGVPSCYRDIAGQEEADRREKAGGPAAATPGYSNHGTGIAVDIYMGPGVFAWLQKNAAKFGFDNVQGKASGENWHWVRTVYVAVAELSATLIKHLLKGDSDMPAIVQVTDVQPNPVYSMSVQQIRHLVGNQPDITSKVFSESDEIHKLNTGQFNDILAALSIPVNQVYHFGGHPVGYGWSVADDLKAQLTAIQKKLGA